MFKLIRIVVLLFIFFAVAFYSKNQKLKSRNWAQPLEVVIYPMNGDNGSELVDKYIQQLDEKTFADIDLFFQRESKKYQIVTSQPTLTHLGKVLTEHPPTEPELRSNMATIVWWGLKFRYWAFNHTPDAKTNNNKVLVFLYYHQDDKNRVLRHSLGLDKGLLTIFMLLHQNSKRRKTTSLLPMKSCTQWVRTINIMHRVSRFSPQVTPNPINNRFIRKPWLKSCQRISRHPVLNRKWRKVWKNVWSALKQP